ncbi:MAG: ACT domain-containing protein [Actinomycetota bacterium]|nr:ACT domain-containing protein [Actinomycetota bacterium]
MQNVVVMLEDRPGALAAVAEALGRAGINIEGFCAFPEPPGGTAHLLVEDAAAAQGVIHQAGGTVRDVRDVLVVDCPNVPGALGEVTRRLADALINLDLVYQATEGRIVLGVTDVEAARRASKT